MKRLMAFFKDDILMSVALLLALGSLAFATSLSDVISSINVDVLIIMSSLMIAVAGMKETNLFGRIAISFSSRFYSLRAVSLAIVWSTFFLGMWVTNDAVLLTLVPFSVIVYKQIGEEKQLIIIVALQTFAANMGASLTPMGDPQNIYLYSFFHLDFWSFVGHMAPITISSLVLISLATWFLIPKRYVHPVMVIPKVETKRLPLYFVIFLTTILVVLRVIPSWVGLMVTGVLTILFFPRLLKQLDFALLITFLCFFVLTGNLIRITALQDWITPFLHGRVTVYFSGLVFSQFMSNVPASVLLSAFLSPTDAYALLQGVNVGAMGTLIGSLASLISFKFISKTLPAQKKEYIRLYSFLSILMIILVSLIVFLF